jgi:aldose 1-epimerase
MTRSLAAAADAPASIELQERNFRAEIDGKPVGLYTIRNAAGMVVRLTNYGAHIEQILVPDRNGRLGDVAQGYESTEQVRGGHVSMGTWRRCRCHCAAWVSS